MSRKKKEEIEIKIESHDNLEDLEELADEIAAAEEERGSDEQEVEAKFKEINEKYVRLYADFENYRKRVAREKEELLKFAPEPLIFELLTVIDTLELALTHANDDDALDSLKKGIEMTLKEFSRVLERSGLKQIEAFGKPFDPEFHEAMTHTKRDDVKPGTVVEEFRKGYALYDKLIRASLVSVSKADEEDNQNEKDADEGMENNNDNDENNNIKEEEENG